MSHWCKPRKFPTLVTHEVFTAMQNYWRFINAMLSHPNDHIWALKMHQGNKLESSNHVLLYIECLNLQASGVLRAKLCTRLNCQQQQLRSALCPLSKWGALWRNRQEFYWDIPWPCDWRRMLQATAMTTSITSIFPIL